MARDIKRRERPMKLIQVTVVKQGHSEKDGPKIFVNPDHVVLVDTDENPDHCAIYTTLIPPLEPIVVYGSPSKIAERFRSHG